MWSRLLKLRFWLFQRHRYRNLVLEQVAGKPLIVLPDVFNPGLFPTGRFLAEQLPHFLQPHHAVLDMGTGTGIGAIFAAQIAQHVTAVDINPEAVRCASINAMLNRAEDRVRICQSDLFAALADQQFDVILFNPPYFRGQPADHLDHAWRSVDVPERFAAELPRYLRQDGFVLLVIATKVDLDQFMRPFEAFHVEEVASQSVIGEVWKVYKISL